MSGELNTGLACLSNLNCFATWVCGVESSASEIFGLVTGRGATALHLWNGSAWVRYSVVDGTMVPAGAQAGPRSEAGTGTNSRIKCWAGLRQLPLRWGAGSQG